MGILKDWWWDIALTLLTKVHPCCLKSQNFLMVFLKPPCLARWFSLRIGSWDFPILNQSHHKTANQRSHDQSPLDICNFTPWLSLAPELRSIHLQILTIVISSDGRKSCCPCIVEWYEARLTMWWAVECQNFCKKCKTLRGLQKLPYARQGPHLTWKSQMGERRG